MNLDYKADAEELTCPVDGCEMAAQDGWWLLSGEFRFACNAHSKKQRDIDAPDGVLDDPPVFAHDAMNPKNVPTPISVDAMRAAIKPSSIAMRVWVYQILADLDGSEDDIRLMCGDGYRDVPSLSQHAVGWLIAELQHAWLTIRPVLADD